jgi:hypothetical protein
MIAAEIFIKGADDSLTRRVKFACLSICRNLRGSINRYQLFLDRSVESEVLGIRVKIANLADVTQSKLWAYRDPQRRLSKHKKDELDLIRWPRPIRS